MIKKILKFQVVTLLIGSNLALSSAWAANLLTIYKQALANDPTFQIASAQWLSDKENISISRGALLPAFDVAANYGRYMQDMKSQSATDYYNQGEYSLALTQPIFNFQAWSKLAQAKATVKSSAAIYSDAAQDLIYRTATAYLAVLQAADVLHFSIAQRTAAGSLLDQTRQRFKVGLSTITDVQQAQANYDSTISAEITAKNSLDITKEQLREITGQYNGPLAKLSANLPLLTPEPNSIERWVGAAEKQNYSLLAAEYNLQAARENIKVQVGNGSPVINAVGTYNYSNAGTSSNLVANQVGSTAMAGVNMSFPVFRGGSTIAQVQQAKYDYQKASAALEQTHRAVVSQTSQAFLGVISGISSVKAGKQSVISNTSALNSTKSSYSFGVKTIVDVLLAESSLYQAQKDYAVAQYAYLMQTLMLKKQAGTLGFEDLRKINSWLQSERTEHIDRPAQQPIMIIKAGNKTIMRAISPNISTKPKPSNNVNILKVNSQHYTIQLLAADNPNKVIAFVNQHNLEKPIYTFKVNNNGHTWYDLVVGEYETRNEAQIAARKLVKILKGVHPWVRTYGSIQSAIRKI